MTDVETSRTITIDPVTGGAVYTVTGPAGAVSYGESPPQIVWHSRTPIGGVEGMPCPHLGGAACWSDTSGIKGRALYEAWLRAGRDPGVLWEALEALYRRAGGDR